MLLNACRFYSVHESFVLLLGQVRRFAEAFFVVENPRPSAAGCYDANYQSYLAVSELVRRSRYLAALPPLPVTCPENDGDVATIPIIFEDQYQEVSEFARRRNMSSARKAGSGQYRSFLLLSNVECMSLQRKLLVSA